MPLASHEWLPGGGANTASSMPGSRSRRVNPITQLSRWSRRLIGQLAAQQDAQVRVDDGLDAVIADVERGLAGKAGLRLARPRAGQSR